MDLLHELPKCELHLHIEGTLEPDLMLKLAERNQISLPYKSEADVRKAYDFKDLQSFLDIYYQGAQVLLHEQDFYDLTWAYLGKCVTDNIIHTEIFFDPQTHTSRGIPIKTVVDGITRALEDGERKLNVSSGLILSFLRDLDEESALKTLEAAKPHLSQIIGVGLDSAEVGHPPSKFKCVFAEAKKLGLRKVAHAGEEAGPDYIWDALHNLGAERIDHGVQAVHDVELLHYLRTHQIPLTVCPLSNIKLKVFENLNAHSLKELLNQDILVTINSDDPAYFGGYLEKNIRDTIDALQLSSAEIIKLIENSFKASFLPEGKKEKFLMQVQDICATYQ